MALGLDESQLRKMMAIKLDEATINEYGRLDNLKATIDKLKAKEYFEAIEGTSIPLFKVNMRAGDLVRDFILKGGYDIQLPQ